MAGDQVPHVVPGARESLKAVGWAGLPFESGEHGAELGGLGVDNGADQGSALLTDTLRDPSILIRGTRRLE